MSAIWVWRWLDQDEMREWLRDAVRRKAGWSLEDLLARLVSPSRMDGGAWQALDMDEVEGMIGVEYAIDNLAPLDEGQRLQPSRDLEPSWSNRIRLARTLLDDERARRIAALT